MTALNAPSDGFEDPEFLKQHIQSILNFYEPRVVDPNGGFFQTFRNNGEVYDPGLRHLVSSSRFIFNYATEYRLNNAAHYRSWAHQGLLFLEDHLRQKNGHFAWELRENSVTDGRAMTYGHAFVMLAAASAFRAGLIEGQKLITNIWEFVEHNFWQPDYHAYADERDSTLKHLDPYRGQNANMHMCEALIAAWEATQEIRYLDRAELLARRFTVELAGRTDGLIWEHYTEDWQRDMQYNIDKPSDLFKPWGFQPGHQFEWAKLLLQLNSHRAQPWYVERAVALYERAMRLGWDERDGGIVYGFAPDGTFSDSHKYFWVHAEAFASAWRLFRVTGEAHYLQDYQRIWQWSWLHLIDHKYGAWFRIRQRDGSPVDDLKSPPGKTDYHTMGACWDVLSQPMAQAESA